MSHRLRLPRRATIAALLAAMAALMAATAVASEPAAAAGKDGFADSSEWVSCADEGQLCSFTGTKQVRYGDYDISGETWMFGRWTVKTVTGPIACTNATFGDPFPDRRKHCEVDESPWKFCAMEGGSCFVPSVKDVRYGVAGYGNGRTPMYWQTWRAWETFDCTNAEFGLDPNPGVVKSCWIRES
jgi:hypothetical protein